MLRTKRADRIVCAAVAAMLLTAACLWGVIESVQGDGSHTVGYESLLFDQSTVHTIDIVMDGWEAFIAGATSEEYAACSLIINGERFENVAIRAKGNTSLSSVAALGSTRYSFKVEFDHYVKGMTYHGLDKLSLNNLIQDATLMKDCLAYTLMNRMGVHSPLCSYVQISVNGEPWGLYLAVEGVEDAFRERNGMTEGEWYKPDSLSFGGGRGNGRDFDFDALQDEMETDDSFGGSSGQPTSPPETPPQMPDAAPGEEQGERRQPGGFGMESSDVKLIYSDDDPDSYANIFDNAKTKISDKDKTRLIESLRKLNAGEGIEQTVDTQEVIRYLVVHSFLCNDDSYTGMMVHNYYLYEQEGRLSIIPWDYNLAFGGFSASSGATSAVNSPIDSPVSGGSIEDRPLIAWIFRDEDALAAYHAVYDQFISDNLESGWLEQEITRVQALIAPYLEKDASAFYSMEAFEQAVVTLQAFCQKRGESIRGQLEGTIPSTTEGQRQSSAALVRADELSLSDMGSMNTGNAPGGGGPPDIPDFSESFSPPAMPTGEDAPGNGDSFDGNAGSSWESAGDSPTEEEPRPSPQAPRPDGQSAPDMPGT